jgi:hypothetical protein
VSVIHCQLIEVFGDGVMKVRRITEFYGGLENTRTDTYDDDCIT